MGESKRFLFKKETGQELEMGDDLILREMSLIEGKALDMGKAVMLPGSAAGMTHVCFHCV